MTTQFFGRVLLPDLVTTIALSPASKLVLANAVLQFNASFAEDDELCDDSSEAMITLQVRVGRDQDNAPWLALCTLSASTDMHWSLNGLVFDGDQDVVVGFRTVGFEAGIVHLTGHIARGDTASTSTSGGARITTSNVTKAKKKGRDAQGSPPEITVGSSGKKQNRTEGSRKKELDYGSEEKNEDEVEDDGQDRVKKQKSAKRGKDGSVEGREKNVVLGNVNDDGTEEEEEEKEEEEEEEEEDQEKIGGGRTNSGSGSRNSAVGGEEEKSEGSKESKRAKKRRRKAEAKRVASQEMEGSASEGGAVMAHKHGDAEGMGEHVKKPKARHLGGGLTIKDTIIGLGSAPTPGKTVKLLYEGLLARTGEVFDKRENKRSPLSFRLGLREVVPGFDKGVQGMRVGGCREIKVPASMGYGHKGAGPIPPNADLIFRVELLRVV